MVMEKIKAVIFDFDGLMVDTEIGSFHIYEEILREYGYSYTIKEYSDHYSGHTEIQNIQNLIQSYNLQISEEACYALAIRKEKELLEKGVNLKKGLVELLKFLKENNYRTAIATSSTKERCLDILLRHHIEGYFDEFVFAEDITHFKPHPEVYLKALDRLKVKPKEAVVLEDAASGIIAATEAGIRTICIPDMKVPEKEILDKATCVCDSLFDVIDLLEKNS